MAPVRPAPQIAPVTTTPPPRAAAAIALLLTLALAACGDGPAAPVGSTVLRFAECAPVESYYPTAAFRENCPAAVGLDSAVLRAAFQHVERDLPNAYSLLVVKDGYLVGEQYYNGARADTRFDVRSIAKSVTLSVVGAALERGDLASLDLTLRSVFPDFFRPTDDPRKLRLTLSHVFSMSAGFDPNGRAAQTTTTIASALTRPMRNDPGTVFYYDELAFHAGAAAVTETLRRDFLDYGNEYLFGPLGFQVEGRDWGTDGLGYTLGTTGLQMTARNLAKIGLLHARGGRWEGRQLLAEHWVDSVGAIHVGGDPFGAGAGYGYGWWIVPLRGYSAIYAEGHGGQWVAVVPDLDLVAVLTANPDVPAGQNVDAYFQVMSRYVMPAVLPKAGPVGASLGPAPYGRSW